MRWTPSTSAKPFSTGSKAEDKAAAEARPGAGYAANLFYADKRYKLLVVLQGTDTSGKDGTIRGVFGRMSALGVHAVGWKAPTEAELAHDPLAHPPAGAAGGRHHGVQPQPLRRRAGARGEWLDHARAAPAAPGHINDFERMLSETGTIVAQVHAAHQRDEQRERLQERLDDPAKHWKFSDGRHRRHANSGRYRRAYEMLLAPRTRPGPMDIVPANSKTHRNLMIAPGARC